MTSSSLAIGPVLTRYLTPDAERKPYSWKPSQKPQTPIAAPYPNSKTIFTLSRPAARNNFKARSAARRPLVHRRRVGVGVAGAGEILPAILLRSDGDEGHEAQRAPQDSRVVHHPARHVRAQTGEHSDHPRFQLALCHRRRRRPADAAAQRQRDLRGLLSQADEILHAQVRRRHGLSRDHRLRLLRHGVSQLPVLGPRRGVPLLRHQHQRAADEGIQGLHLRRAGEASEIHGRSRALHRTRRHRRSRLHAADGFSHHRRDDFENPARQERARLLFRIRLGAQMGRPAPLRQSADPTPKTKTP